MGLLDTLLGRSKPVQPNLDQLFGLPSAALTLEVNGTFRPTGYGSVCYRRAEGVAFSQVESDVEELLEGIDGPKVQVSKDKYGYTWLLCQRPQDDLRPVPAVHPGQLPGRSRPQAGADLPLQAGDVLSLRAAHRAAAGQHAGAADQVPAGQRPAAREGPVPLVPGLGRARPVTGSSARTQTTTTHVTPLPRFGFRLASPGVHTARLGAR